MFDLWKIIGVLPLRIVLQRSTSDERFGKTAFLILRLRLKLILSCPATTLLETARLVLHKVFVP